MNLEQRVAALEQQLRQAQRDLNRLPLYVPPFPRTQVIQIIGGQTVSTVGCILYSDTDPTLTALYDADVDTVYPDGLGNGWLMNEYGRQDRRVLVRHDFAGATGPLVGGWGYVVRGTKTLTVASGAHAGETMTAYTVTWQL